MTIHVSFPLRLLIAHSVSGIKLTPPPSVTRSHKANERDHVGLANGTADPDQHLPRYFGKSGHVDSDPKGIKKSGGGKGNWYAEVALSPTTTLAAFSN